MNNADKKMSEITKLIREIKSKKKDITTELIGVYVSKKFHPDGLMKTGAKIEGVSKRLKKQFDGRELFHQEDGLQKLNEYNEFVDEILSYKELVKKKRMNQLIVGGAIAIFVFWLSMNNIDKKYENTSYSTSSYVSKNKLKDDCKWCNILRYAILKNDNNRAVQCRQNYINNGYYILCTYEAGGYNKRALFYEGLNEVYAVNGTARAKTFTRHSDIKLYDSSTQGAVDIREILSKF